MAEPRREVNRAAQPSPPRQHGLLWNLLWGWPWMLVGILFSSLLLSLLVEYIGIAFFWPEQGAAHSEAVMKTELGWLSSEFTRSLLLSTRKRKLTAVCSHQTRIGNLDAHLI